MPATTLNNNQVATVVNAAIAQATGASSVATMDLEGIIDAVLRESLMPETIPVL